MTLAEQVHQAVAGRTITGLLRRNAEQFPAEPALSTGVGPQARTLSWAELRGEVAAVTRGLSAVGLRRGDRMLIAMAKRPEHWIVDLAAAHIGAISCTVYDTLSSEQIRFVAQHSAATVLVVEAGEHWARCRPVLDDLPSLRTVVVVDPVENRSGEKHFVSYPDVRGSGLSAEFASAFERLADAALPEAPLSAVYTSGTTGDPKGVVLSHRNVIHQSMMQHHLMPLPAHPRSVSYLPLAHIAERILGIYQPICTAGHVTICPEPADLLPTLLAVRPHSFFGVPRVWEKIAAGLRARVDALPDSDQAVMQQARERALRAFRLRSEGAEIPSDLAERQEEFDTVLRPLRAAVGLDHSERNFSGAAPIPVAVIECLASVGIPVYQVWGLSETAGCATISTPEAFTIAGAGRAAPGVEVRTDGDGELLVRGPVVFSGYLRSDGTVTDATDPDGWLATGDIGVIDDRGIVSITDRKKDLLITSGGKNIAPTRIETLLRAHPLIAHAVAIGEGRPYVTALIVLDEDIAQDWAMSGRFAPADGVRRESSSESVPLDLPSLARHPQVHSEVESAVGQANHSLSRAEQIKAFHVLTVAWTAETGELTPKLSLRRTVINLRYSAEIERLYH